MDFAEFADSIPDKSDHTEVWRATHIDPQSKAAGPATECEARSTLFRARRVDRSRLQSKDDRRARIRYEGATCRRAIAGAEFQIEAAAYLDFRHDHRREPEPADFALRGESLGLDCDVVSAVFQRRDLGVVPLIAKPLSVGESLAFGPRDETLGGPDHGIALVWPGNADVCHAACRACRGFSH